MTREILMEWSNIDGSDPTEPFYRLVGIEESPGVFDHVIEKRFNDAMGAACWATLSNYRQAMADLAYYMFITGLRLGNKE